ncbi:MAG: sulfatase-like hydrolase/transferase [Bacteroidales bacterium]|nr:sulfatase-like hydrolase/transferase [Bacteroidales bacterium]
MGKNNNCLVNVLASSGLVLFGLSAVASATVKAPKKKNLLFIMTDQQQYIAMGMAGNKVLKTPNLDRLAREGAFFKNAYSACAVSGPARSSILTGCTVERTGVNTNSKTYYYNDEKVMAMPTFDEILTDQGYRCEYYGKWHSLSSHAEIYRNPKQESLDGMSVFGHGGQNHVYIDYINHHFPKAPLDAGELYDSFTQRPYVPDPLDKFYGQNYQDVEQAYKKAVQPDFHGKLLVPAEHSFTAFQAKETLEALERLKDTTFSITCSFHFPHSPLIAPEPYYSMYLPSDMPVPESIIDEMDNSPYRNANGRLSHPEYADAEKIQYMISNYYGLITEIDDWVGRILQKLDELGLSDNTLVVFTSDHGEMLGAHGLREKNVFYEESSHIPLMIKSPGAIQTNTFVEGYVSHVDIFATILDYLEAGQYPSDGKSLRGLIEGTDDDYGKYVVTEWNYRGDVSPNYMIVKDGWKLLIPYSKESKVLNALYNLNEDPYEMNNLLGKNPDKQKHLSKANELKGYLLEWLEKNQSKHFSGVNSRPLL